MKSSLFYFSFLLICFSFSCSNQQKSNNDNTTTTNVRPVGQDTSAPTINREASFNPYATVDVSPMDMSYFPIEYPKLKMAHATAVPPKARIVYSRPHLQGRHLFHNVLKYEEPWRLGANEASEIQLYQDATIQGKKVAAGRYILYAIPHPDKWTIVFNSNIDSWGLEQDTTKDVARFDATVKKTGNRLEYFTMVFENSNAGADLMMAWDDVEARLPISF